MLVTWNSQKSEFKSKGENTMKKIVSLMLALLMLLTMVTSAAAMRWN